MFQRIRSSVLPIVLTLVVVATGSAARAASGSTYGEKDIQIQAVKLLKDGTVQITFASKAETLYYCPGANAKHTDRGLELTFVRAFIKRKPKVDFPAVHADEEQLFKSLKVKPGSKPVFLKDGKSLIQIYPDS